MNKRTLANEAPQHIGNSVTLTGWVQTRRDHGKLVFVDFRDRSGLIQCVIKPDAKDVYEIAQNIRDEWVLTITGEVIERPEKMKNENLATGGVEIVVSEIEVLNESKPMPFPIDTDGQDINEETRLKYRYLDLRRERLQKNMRLRSTFVDSCRQFLFEKDFVEIETPLLTKSTPEGSRDFVVPSRLKQGSFYALPQSPQQYKQLLMTAGFERYFQIAKALRDEDLRADRAFEHTQIDLEISFVKRDDVIEMVEAMMTTAVETLGLTIKEKPFPRLPYAEAIKKYGTDSPDLRSEDDKKNGILAYVWVVDFPFFEKTDDGKWTFTHNPFSMPIEEHIPLLLEGKKIDKIITTQYDLVCNGSESAGGSIRAHKPEILEATYRIMNYNDEEIQNSVGHMLEAFSYGTPPHGGIALGIERNIMNLSGENYLREVQAFPMTGGGQTSVMRAPTQLSSKQLDELGITIKEPPDEAN